VEGLRRITIPLPMGPGHVHCYVAGSLLVDTGLGTPQLDEVLDGQLDGIERVVITHFHPDHIGGGEAVKRLTGATFHQGRLDYDQTERVWGTPDWPERMAAWFKRHGVPGPIADQILEEGELAKPLIRFARDPELLDEGDDLDGWQIVPLPGHADGHIGLLRGGVLVGGDHLLPDITPAVGLYPESEPDPLGAYLRSLEQTIELAPRLALPAHGEPIADPAGRAREIIRHHEERLDACLAALGPEPRTAYEASLAVFGPELGHSQRRFAVAETLSHLEHLVERGRARRFGDVDPVAYTQR
jgi:glyoxylase-like metal-dependent hydrolase (beta-lactamase superfamily II)